METDAYIALGSNLGDRELNLLRAVAEIGRLEGCRVTAISRFYETEPVGMAAGTPAFYNAVARVTTTVPPGELLARLLEIEKNLFGRKPSPQPESRMMDLDLLLYGNLEMDTEQLVLPHPRMAERRFVLVPLADIAAGQTDPRTGRTIAALLADIVSDEQPRPLE